MNHSLSPSISAPWWDFYGEFHSGLTRTEKSLGLYWTILGSDFLARFKPEGKKIHISVSLPPQMLTYLTPEGSSIKSQQQMDAKSEETAQVYELFYLIACEVFEDVVF